MLGLKSPRLASWQLGNKPPADATNLVAQMFAAQCVDAPGVALSLDMFMRQINALGRSVTHATNPIRVYLLDSLTDSKKLELQRKDATWPGSLRQHEVASLLASTVDATLH